jgi:antitoxin component HigA of HigAB toxin-antitoxin module
MMYAQLEKFVENPENRRIYEQERLLVDATELLSTVMEKTGTKRAELAQRLKKSKAYVTQILRGNQNLTLKTLADAFFALNHRLLVVAEPMAAGAGLVLTRQWNVTQHAGNRVVTNDYSPSEEFYGEIAA